MTTQLLDRPRVRPTWLDWFDGDVGRFFDRFGWPTLGEDRLRIEEMMEDGTLIVRAEVPGVDPDKDVEVTLDGRYLTIRAERRDERSDKGDRAFRTEFHYGSFARTFQVPEGVQADDVTASYKDGVLEVRVAMPATLAGPTPQKVAVTHG
jgi:HSP20 family protein